MRNTKKIVRRIVILLVVLGIIGGGAAYWYKSTQKPAVTFLTAPVTKGSLRSAILSTGNIQAVSVVNVGTQISGTVKAIYVDYNSVVKKGQLIALIDPATQEADLASARASLAAAHADVTNAQANLVNAVKTLSRTRELIKGDLIAKAQLDSDETSVLNARASLAAMSAKVRQQQANVQKCELELSYTRIYSPVDGVVISKSVDVGQTVAASFNTPTIAEIAEDLSNMQVEVNIDEADVGNVHNGQKAEFTVDAFPDRDYTGTVTQIRLSPITTNSVVTYTAIVSFKNVRYTDKQNLMPGMTATVTLLVAEKDDVLIVPNAALRFRPLTTTDIAQAGEQGRTRQQAGSTAANGNGKPQKRKSTVYELKDGQPVRVEVETGITDGTSTELKEGAKEGMQVIVGIEAPKDQ